ncbi:U-box domain-containing protein 35 [Cardamine amara subsp. amara]|uniref:RING-type E3 ubiquitin transferase n=1 Tax=Cardamine amara subsp. amara TaxID=228776 RepID=A0ABD0Z6Z6_CARAN
MVKKVEGERRDESVVVAIDRDKGSQAALKWAVENLLTPGETLTLVHVRVKQTLPNGTNPNKSGDDVKELLLPFRCFCSRKDIKCEDVVLEDVDAAKGIIDYVQENAIDILVLGASKMTLLKRFKSVDVTSTVMKGAPSFCTVYAISRGKISSVKSATSSPPPLCTIRSPLPDRPSNASTSNSIPRAERRHQPTQRIQDEIDIKFPYLRGGTYPASVTDSDLSFVSSDRPSVDWMFPTPRLSVSSDFEDNRCSFATTSTSTSSEKQSIDLCSSYSAFSSSSQESGRLSSAWSIHSQDEVEAEMRRLKMELKYTMDMYSTACKEAIAAKRKTTELHKWRIERDQKLEEARLAKEAAMAIAENEKEKSRAAMEALATANRMAEIEAQKRKKIEMAALREADDNNIAMQSFTQSDRRYRKYTIEEIEEATENFSKTRKIGEGGYGPVYKGTLDYTLVAIKVVRPDAVQGRSQFQKEVEVLTSIRHPNMVLLLGACTEYGCLVYEYMANGSLEDRLLRRGNSHVLSWQLRFRIAAEIATSLNFLHQLKPEPLVHRDMKPANILLDKHMVSKIADVGLARLLPPSVSDTATQYKMTSAAGTLSYIDPEYQHTGMLGTTSDMYSFGITLLQILTAKPPMGLTSQIEKAIEEGTFAEILDPTVLDWPLEEALVLAKIGLQCAVLRRKDRPNLENDVLPELKRLMELAEENMPIMHPSSNSSRNNSQPDSLVASTASIQEIISNPSLNKYGYDESCNNSTTS